MRTLIIGASTNEDRYSYKAIQELRKLNFDVCALGLKDGEVMEIDRKQNRAKVKGINIVKKHVKTTKEKKGGIVSKENFIHLSNLSIIESKKEAAKK